MFQNRQEAGRALAKRLGPLDPATTVILALPRGGVPVAAEICKATKAPLDLALVRKVGAPGHGELAVGAIAYGPELILVTNYDVAASFDLSDRDVRMLARREHEELERRHTLYLGSQPVLDLTGKTAVLVDDGIATGATMRAAIKAVRARNARRVVVAVAVAPRSTISELQGEADEVVCLEMPEPFWAVGQHYAEFPQVTDAEVIAALARPANAERRPR